MSYNFISTLNYTNSGGVKIDNDPTHTLQLNPSIRFIGNTKNGWQPYATVGMVWNIMNKTHSMANGIALPEMSTKPYIEYGIGLQKLWNDNLSAYGQATVRNGGRTGVALTAGVKWNLGKDGSSKGTEKVLAPVPNKVLTTKQTTEKIVPAKSTPALPAKREKVEKQKETHETTVSTVLEKKIIKQLTTQEKLNLIRKAGGTTRTDVAAISKGI
ncbi:autotransporter outer membrane beta-barrel domain-containing protein, partial [bacterium]|nr:autotransporter outer membrane beta-barrel domain-containing protein [bacterium]